jgi:hypothetical protein
VKFDYQRPESRRNLAQLILKLFSLWNLSETDRLQLLGLQTSLALERFTQGEELLTDDILDRIGWLLSIHKALRALYPKNSEICYGWINRRNTAFDDSTPLAVAKEGIIGLARVAHYLDHYLEL